MFNILFYVEINIINYNIYDYLLFCLKRGYLNNFRFVNNFNEGILMKECDFNVWKSRRHFRGKNI